MIYYFVHADSRSWNVKRMFSFCQDIKKTWRASGYHTNFSIADRKYSFDSVVH